MEAKQVRSLMEAYASVYEGYDKKKKEKGCVDKEDKGDHNCAKKVCHEQFGTGTCVFGEHSAPDENGVVQYYDVLFEHGIEQDVPLVELEVLEEGSHNEDYHRYEGEVVDEGMGLVTGAAKAINSALKPKGQTPEQGKEAVRNLTRAMDVVAKPVKSAAKAVLGVGDEKNEAMKNKRRPTAAQAERVSRMEEFDSFDLVQAYLIDEGHADTEEDAMYIMANMTEESRTEILDFIESMASASRMKEIKEKGFERPARSREFEKRLPTERGSRGPEFEHGSTRSSDKPSGNLSANRGRGSRGPEFRHGSGEGPYDTRGTAIKNPENLSRNTGRYPRDKKGNLMY
jgi:hypothetical protein